jgi:hypothetical protein
MKFVTVKDLQASSANIWQSLLTPLSDKNT